MKLWEVFLAFSLLALSLNADLVESFEDGNFLANDWNFTGNANWEIVDNTAADGTYSAKSGLIYDSQTSGLEITLNFEQAGTISFSRKVSSEESGASFYDGLRFYMDSVVVAEWGGAYDWENFSYEVPAGVHSFLWNYEKDYTTAIGEDCAYLDNIIATNATAVEDNDAPEIISFSELTGFTNEPLSVNLKIKDASEIAYAKLHYKFQGAEEQILELNQNSKTRRIYEFAGEITAQGSFQIGFAYFEIEDAKGFKTISEQYQIIILDNDYLELSQGFEGMFAWETENVLGTEGEWTVESEALSPDGMQPQEGSKLLRFNSYFCSDENATRLIFPELNSFNYGGQLRFYLLHSLGNTWANDSLVVEMREDNGNWNELTYFLRYTGDPNIWVGHVVELPAMDSQKFQLAFTGYSKHGRDINIDNIKIYQYPTTEITEINLPQNNLIKNYPNPFNPSTTIEYQLPERMEIEVAIYNIKGEKFASLDRGLKKAGLHQIKFEGANLASGIYFCKIIAKNKILYSHKLMLLK